MASVLDTAELMDSEDQTAFNLAGWEKVLADRPPGNTRRELREKKALFFAAGADEVWFCHRDGRMEFFCKAAPETPASSVLCPAFPQRIQIE